MVLKHCCINSYHKSEFENDVKTYGTQAQRYEKQEELLFENDVKTYGTQAIPYAISGATQFENDVKTYGTQAPRRSATASAGLRMM